MASAIPPPNPNASHDGNFARASATTVAQPLLNYLFPGFSLVSDNILRHLNIDINSHIPLLLVLSALTFVWNYITNFIWGYVEDYCMCTVDIRYEDEIYDALVHWVSRQPFASNSRRFVVISNTRSRENYWDPDFSDNDDDDEPMTHEQEVKKHKNALAYTPSFGSHSFWFRGNLLRFSRSENKNQTVLNTSDREEISISCYGRNPNVLKDLLIEARIAYTQKDHKKTVIYRATCRYSGSEPVWQRSVSRAVRPMSTVILNEQVKEELMSDITDYLNPATRRWYSNRGIPYRRGYLLYGPPGTGKSSFSLALAGHFKMKVYIVSLSSTAATEENLAQLFSELPRRCVVLLEDIDSAGLTHTRDEPDTENSAAVPASPTGPDSFSTSKPAGRLSLSGLLNILDGVASNEGRLLIMTTNHLEKLDSALIRPGRVDMTLEFGLADYGICVSLFRAIFSSFIDDDPLYTPGTDTAKSDSIQIVNKQEMAKMEEKHAAKQETYDAEIAILAKEFAAKVPEKEFSPAELQGFLLKHKLRPHSALEKVDGWVVDMREKRRKEKLESEEKAKREEEEKAKKEAEEKSKKEEEEKSKKEEEEKEKKASEEREKAEQGEKANKEKEAKVTVE